LDGHWLDGTWKKGDWKTGKILDPEDGSETESEISPKDFELL
jgi:hypothetical protein